MRAFAAGLSHLALALGLMVFPTASSLAADTAPAKSAPQSHLRFLQADGSRIADDAHQRVILRGCNVGNWLLIEPWMFGGTISAADQHSMLTSLQSRFGADRTNHLMTLYRNGYITPRDFDLIKSFGFNVVRLPFDYHLLQQDEPPYALKADAFEYLDRALDMAEAADIYVILDLHGVPGGQSKDGCTGQGGRNQLWTSQSNLDRTVAIWRAVAKRYRNRSVVAAYDLVNEPFGNYNQDLSPDLRSLCQRLYTAIREVGDRHLIVMDGSIGIGIEFYGAPADHGWKNVGFTEHYYPGLFGDKTAVESHARVLNLAFPRKQAYLERIGAPYLVGEFNPIFDSVGGSRMMRQYYDRMAGYGWAATMWSYKLLQIEGGAKSQAWYLVTNAAPLPKLDLQTSSYEQFEQFFTGLAKMELAINEPVRQALLDPSPKSLPLTRYPQAPTAAPAQSVQIDGWTSTDIGNPARGATLREPDGTTILYAGGSDIFGTSDSFRFLSRPATAGKADLAIRVQSLLESDTWAKAGVMARWGDSADAPFAMVNTFPNGTVALAVRPSQGSRVIETKITTDAAPIDLRLHVEAGKATGYYRCPGETWKTIGTAEVPTSESFRIGLASVSHNDQGLTIARFRMLDEADRGIAPAAISNALAIAIPNATFSEAANGDQAAHWNHWGTWKRASTGDQSAMESPADQYSGFWQDVPAKPDQRYTFTISARRNPSASIDANATFELRLESTQDGQQLTLNQESYHLSDLAKDGSPTRLSVRGTSISSTLRLLVIVSPSRDGGATGSPVTVDSVSLTQTANHE